MAHYTTRGEFLAQYPEGPTSRGPYGVDLLIDVAALTRLPANRAEKRAQARHGAASLGYFGRQLRKTANWMNQSNGLGTRYRQNRRLEEDTPELDAYIEELFG